MADQNRYQKQAQAATELAGVYQSLNDLEQRLRKNQEEREALEQQMAQVRKQVSEVRGRVESVGNEADDAEHK